MGARPAGIVSVILRRGSSPYFALELSEGHGGNPRDRVWLMLQRKSVPSNFPGSFELQRVLQKVLQRLLQ